MRLEGSEEAADDLSDTLRSREWSSCFAKAVDGNDSMSKIPIIGSAI